jgi:anti-sigma factor RsiW/uncharacterized protein YegL
MPHKPQEELESSLTALLLGELPHERAAALHQKLAQDAELAKLYERLKHTINLVRETLASPAAQTADQPTLLKLSDQRRQKLLQQFKTVTAKEFIPPRRRAMPWLVPVGIAAALVVILGGLFLPALTRTKSRSQSLAFGTWSRSEPAASAPLVPPVADIARDSQDLNRWPATPARLEGPAPAKPAGTQQGETALRLRFAKPSSQIILPESSELADAATTPAAEGVQPGFTVSGTTRGFYDDSPGRSGGMGGGGGFGGGGLGGSGGGMRGDTSATKGQQKGPAAAVEGFRIYSFGEPSTPPLLAGDSSQTLKYKADGIVPTVGPDGQPLPSAPQSQPFVSRYAYLALPEAAKDTGASTGSGGPARQYPNSTTIGDAFFSVDPETRRLANIEAQPPAAVPAFSAKLAPAQEALGKAAASLSAPGPALALAEPASAGKSVEVAAVPSQMLGKDIKAGDLTAGLRAAVPGKLAPDVSNAGELKQALAAEGRPSPSSSSSAGGAYGGYLSKQKAPSGGDQGVAQSRPALRSPKEGGLAAGAGGVAMAPAPSGPQETAVNEAALRQAEADQVPVLGDVPLIGRRFQSTSGAKGDNVEANAGSFTTGQTKNEITSLGATRALTEERIKSAELADDFDSERQKSATEGQTRRPDSRGANAHGLDIAGYVNAPLTQTNAVAGLPAEPSTTERYTHYRLLSQLGTDFSGASRPAQSSIVLPAAPSETGLALKDSSGKDVQLLAAANQFGIAPAVPEDTRKQGAEDAAKQSRPQIIITGTTTITKPAALTPIPQPEERLAREAKKEFDEKLPAGAIDLQQAKPDLVLDLYGKLVNREILRPATLPAPAITLSTQTPLTKREAVQALEGALAFNGITMVNVGDKFVKALPEAQGITAGARLGTNSAAQLPEAGQYVTQVVQLHHTKPSELVAALQPLSKLPNAILPIDSSQLLVLRDTPENAKRMAEMIAKADAAGGKEDWTPEVARKPSAAAPIPQPEAQTAENAFSTFSLNVSDVSFKLAATSLEKGVMPEPATVRSEEFINAFDYRDPEPPPGVPVAFAWERAQYPFAQNRDLLRFSIKTAALGRQPGRPLNLVLLLDNSGSMERADRVRIIHEALRVLASQLQPQDKFSVVTFARTAHLWVDGVPGNQAAQVAEEVSGLTPQGGTNLEEAMNLGYQTALRHYLANGINRVVLLTDGAANLGNVDPEALKQKVEANRKQGIALDCFGIGWEGYNDDLLEVLTRNGDGRYGFVNTPEEAATEFAGQLAGALHVAASDVKVQVEFNPARVTAYRQIGYAKHQLTKEQFRDNTVNAAQIGAAESGNALYVVEVNPAGDGPLAIVRVRYRIPGTTDYREHEWPVPYTGNAVALEQASLAMRLAATASAFSEWLVSSPYAGEVTPDRLLGYLGGVPEVYGADARPKKLEWMIRQAQSIAGK